MGELLDDETGLSSEELAEWKIVWELRHKEHEERMEEARNNRGR